jgi:hypothetical protein
MDVHTYIHTDIHTWMYTHTHTHTHTHEHTHTFLPTGFREEEQWFYSEMCFRKATQTFKLGARDLADSYYNLGASLVCTEIAKSEKANRPVE